MAFAATGVDCLARRSPQIEGCNMMRMSARSIRSFSSIRCKAVRTAPAHGAEPMLCLCSAAIHACHTKITMEYRLCT